MKRLILLIIVVALVATGWLLRQSYATKSAQVADQLATMTDQTTATTTLNNLKDYVAQHPGSGVTVTLTADYNQAIKAAQLAAASTPNAALYAAAQAACGGRGVNSVTQAQCNQAYIQSHTTATGGVPINAPNLSDYTYHLTAPLVAPDAATICFALALIVLIAMLWPSRRRVGHPGSYL